MMKNKYLILIISCWVLLALCIVAKLFGANIFIASTNNKMFIDFCNYVQNSFLYYIITPLFNIVSTSIFLMAVLKQKKPQLKWLLPYIAYAIIKTIFNKLDVLFFILDIAMMIIIPIIVDKTKWLRALIGIVLNLAFQFISMGLKLNNYQMFDNNLVVGIILTIDYYIMLVLYWLYSIEKRKEEVQE